jgi:hypothetical protein
MKKTATHRTGKMTDLQQSGKIGQWMDQEPSEWSLARVVYTLVVVAVMGIMIIVNVIDIIEGSRQPSKFGYVVLFSFFILGHVKNLKVMYRRYAGKK